MFLHNWMLKAMVYRSSFHLRAGTWWSSW